MKWRVRILKQTRISKFKRNANVSIPLEHLQVTQTKTQPNLDKPKAITSNSSGSYDTKMLANIIHDQDRTLREKEHIPLNLNKFLSAYPPQPEQPHIDVQIQEAIEELRRLKAEHIELKTKEYFMTTILNAKSLDDLPTSRDTGRAEVKLQEEKRHLRKIKAERAKEEQNLIQVVEQLGNTLEDHKNVYEEAQLRLRQARTALKASEVEDMLNRRDVSQIESLVDDIDDLDAATCRKIISALDEERRAMERSANSQSLSVENLRNEVEELETDVRNLRSEANELKEKIATEDDRNPSLARLRHESMLQKEVESLLSALTGVRVSEIGANGISFEINGLLLLPFHPNVDVDRRKCTHTLSIQLTGEESGEPYVSSVIVQPADFMVADLCNERGMGLTQAVQMVCARLAAHLSSQLSQTSP